MLLLTSVLAAYSQAGQKTAGGAGYNIHLLKDCQLVETLPMNAELTGIYRELQYQEALMAKLELPIDAISGQIDDYSQQIEQLTGLAIQENENSLYIDKAYLAEQEAVSDKLDRLIALHQQDFAALEKQGHKIELVARDFEKELREVIRGFDYEHIRITSSGNDQSHTGCESGITIL